MLSVGADMRKINFCFKYFKELYLQIKANGSTTNKVSNNSSKPANTTILDSSHYDSKEMKDLKETLRQRDNEINILVNMLKKEKKKTMDASSGKPPVNLYSSTNSSSILNDTNLSINDEDTLVDYKKNVQPKRQIRNKQNYQN